MKRVGALLRDPDTCVSLRTRLAEARALESWPELVGSHLASRTRPLRLAGGRLFVVAHGSALRQELTYHKRTILRRFNELCGHRLARDIVFLESDEKLSSLVEKEGPVTEMAVPIREETIEPDEGSTDETAEENPGGQAYEVFNAESYRRELGVIVGAGNQTGTEPWEKQ